MAVQKLSQTPQGHLDAEASATLRDQLVGELREIASSDDAAIWAHRILGAKNSLTETDARRVEDAFEVKLKTLGRTGDYNPSSPIISASSLARAAEGFEKSRLTHPELRRIRDREHVKFVAKRVEKSWRGSDHHRSRIVVGNPSPPDDFNYGGNR